MNTSENSGDAQTLTFMTRDSNQVYVRELARVSTADTKHTPFGGTFQNAECFGEFDPLCTAETHLHPSTIEPRC